MRRILDALTVTDARGTTYPPAAMWRKTVVLVVGSLLLVGATFVVGVAWEALH
ncbi:MAG: hypothetical protein IT200_18275 [Thermoleophilia bacterium]|nr:hypothetical protein [Thermoleophilia bacterium]